MKQKNLRIGILTFHKSINYGAFLQCYSLSTKLKEDFPDIDVEVIDYCPQYEIDKYDPSLKTFLFGSKQIPQTPKMIAKNIIKLFVMPKLLKQKKQQYQAFQCAQSELTLSEKHWYTDDYESFFNDIKDQYDIIIVGSDAVWECLVFSFPSAYFLSDTLHARRMSYAACSGRMHKALVDTQQEEYMRKVWQGFTYVGVRDDATEAMVKSIAPGITTYHNCDPTFFLDISNKPLFNKEQVRRKLIGAGINLDKPIIGIMGGDQMGKMVREFFGNEYQVVAVYYQNRYADVFLADLTPFEWAVVFSYFTITFTRYFHGTIFSLKNGTPTISIDDWKNNEFGQSSKLKDMLYRTGLESHYFTIDETRTAEGRNRIKESARKFITSPDKKEIESGLLKEAMHYEEFRDHLQRNIIEIEAK